jgi:plastocyanin
MVRKQEIVRPAGRRWLVLLIGGLVFTASASLPATAAGNPRLNPTGQLRLVAGQSGPTVQATIDNFTFAPKTLTVKAGTTIHWTNKDDSPHTVTSDQGVFASPLMDTDQSFQYTFTKPGKFTYFCKLHPAMTGVVVVE